MIKIEKTRINNFDAAIRGMRNPMNSWDKSDSICGIGQIKYNDAAAEVANNWVLYQDSKIDIWSEEYENLYQKYYSWLISNGILEINDDNTCMKYSFLGPADLKRMSALCKAGTDESKFMRQIEISVDITAPLYWWKEFDTYKVGTVSNSCSTMHKVTSKKFTFDDFSHDHLLNSWGEDKDLYLYNVEYSNTSYDILDWIIGALNHFRNLYLETKDKKYWWQIIQLLPSSYNQKRTISLNYQVLRNIYFARRQHKLDEWREFTRYIEELPYSKELICVESKNGQ